MEMFWPAFSPPHAALLFLLQFFSRVLKVQARVRHLLGPPLAVLELASLVRFCIIRSCGPIMGRRSPATKGDMQAVGLQGIQVDTRRNRPGMLFGWTHRHVSRHG